MVFFIRSSLMLFGLLLLSLGGGSSRRTTTTRAFTSPFVAPVRHVNNKPGWTTRTTDPLPPSLITTSNTKNHNNRESTAGVMTTATTSTRTALHSSLALPVTTTVIKSATALLVAAATLILQRRRVNNFLYPNSAPDKAFDEPLPPGPINGCPFLGNMSWMTNMNEILLKLSLKLGSPTIWKFFALTKPIAVLSGSSATNQMLNKEFKGQVSQMTQFGNLVELLGNQSLAFETKSKKRYQFMRQLVGQALTEEAVAKGVPALQDAASNSIDRVIELNQGSSNKNKKKDTTIVMKDVCSYLTLEVAWRQIIGLDLKTDEEIATFHEATHDFMNAFNNYYLTFLPKWMVHRTRGYKASRYLVGKIEERIDSLLKNGPDGSTMSAMVFATDETEETKKLSRQQVIDNALVLIIAGSETSSLTLTNAMLLLGTHPDSWQKIVAEQDTLVAKHGPSLTKDQIDKECPYLDAVVKETMRLTPVSGGGLRTTDETIIVDGKQVPKKWLALYSIYLTHANDPITWKEDGTHMNLQIGFEPNRWLDKSTRPTTEFMPWGAGNRFCVGWILAATEMRIFLAILARKMKSFNLVTDMKKCKWKEGIIKTPKDGVVISPLVTTAL